MDPKDLKKIVEIMNDNDLAEVEIEEEGKRLRLRKMEGPAPLPAPAPNPAPAAPAPVAAEEPAAPAAEPVATPGSKVITAPMVGTFYRSPSPEAAAFVDVGVHVSPDTVVCILEAMKVMNEIKAETSGEITRILVDNGEAVEFGQPLFEIRAG